MFGGGVDASQTEELLGRVIGRYFGSGDFNGLYVGHGSEDGAAAEELVRDGTVEVISEQDFPNPHIRPWASRTSSAEQLKALRGAVDGSTYGVCLYPTERALAGHPGLKKFAPEPYRARLAAGAGQLDAAYFRMDVVEGYRNDPRFSYQFDDFGAHVAVRDNVFMDENELADDKVSMRLGFAYRLPPEKDAPIVRLVCAFLRDLAHSLLRTRGAGRPTSFHLTEQSRIRSGGRRRWGTGSRLRHTIEVIVAALGIPALVAAV